MEGSFVAWKKLVEISSRIWGQKNGTTSYVTFGQYAISRKEKKKRSTHGLCVEESSNLCVLYVAKNALELSHFCLRFYRLLCNIQKVSLTIIWGHNRVALLFGRYNFTLCHEKSCQIAGQPYPVLQLWWMMLFDGKEGGEYKKDRKIAWFQLLAIFPGNLIVLSVWVYTLATLFPTATLTAYKIYGHIKHETGREVKMYSTKVTRSEKKTDWMWHENEWSQYPNPSMF